MNTKRLVIPYKPRDVFRPYHNRTQRFSVIVAHRRCGKTVAVLNDMIRRAVLCPHTHGRYAYVAPYLSQAKEIAWEYLKRYAQPIITSANESELWVELINGARIRCHGADNPDRLRGGYLDGCVGDERGDWRSGVYGEVIRPMLSDRQGWHTDIGTPKGKNDFYDVWQSAGGDPGKYYRVMLRASETGIINPAELESARRDMTPEQYEQEFECSFEAAILGAYYGREIAQCERDGRIRSVPVMPGYQVHTAWDLGKGQNMPVWCWQVIDSQIHIVDYLQDYHYTIERICEELNKRGYHGTDWVPHDARAPSLETGRTRVETLTRMGRRPALVPDHRVMDGINAARLTLPLVHFDQDKCDEGIEALRQYRADYDDKAKVFKDAPKHDWASHPADAFRYLAMAWQAQRPNPPKRDSRIREGLLTFGDLEKMTEDY